MFHPDHHLRIARLQELMRQQGVDALLASSNVNLYYLFGQIYSGVALVPSSGAPLYLIRRPQSYGTMEGVHYIRKIEDLASLIDTSSIDTIALELDEQSYADIQRQHKIFPSATLANGTSLLRSARMLKTPTEISAIRTGAERHMAVYREVAGLYRAGMTDVELQVEIERVMRLSGSVGVFRTFGSAMEIHMGSLIAGDNASAASPYDFAMGGAGSDALPLGSNGTPLVEGMSVMIDMAGNYGPYLTDMTRTFSIGRLSDEAYRLHDLSRRMHREIMQTATPGTTCAELYTRSLELAEAEGAGANFMGLGQQAQFVGHGLGLQINELPVLTGRSRDVLTPGMVIAFEPKFVLPHVGAVGVENTYLITETGVENLTPLADEIIDLTA